MGLLTVFLICALAYIQYGDAAECGIEGPKRRSSGLNMLRDITPTTQNISHTSRAGDLWLRNGRVIRPKRMYHDAHISQDALLRMYEKYQRSELDDDINGRIVGGVEATEHAWPWQVALFIDNAWFCGGSIISENYILTAAHCADGAGFFDVMAGAHNVRESSEPNRVEVTSYNGWTHPQWNSNDLSNDLALIELPSPLPMNDYISTACLPASGETPALGSMTTVTGWGKPSDSAGGISPVLREVRDVPVMSNSDCNAVYGIVGPGVICIDTKGGRGSCNGDSGGPLVQMFGSNSFRSPGDKWTQIGIVSFGASAGCEAGMPAGFTRTEYYLDWINDETRL